MNELSKNLEKEMRARSLNAYQLELMSGVPQPTIHRILKGGHKDPRTTTVKKLAAGLGISEAELRGFSPEQLTTAVKVMDTISPGDEFLPVRMVSFRLQAGVTGYALDYLDEDKTPIFFRADWFGEKGYKPDKLVACQIKGESMEPRLYDGDIVIVNMEDNTPSDGNVFAVNYEGEMVIKRLIRDAGHWHLQSDNPDKTRHPNKLCSGDICLILGKVVYKQSAEI